MGIVIGIDPGLSGAIVAVDGRDMAYHDMPTVEVRGRRHVDAYRLREILRGMDADMVVLEHVQGVQGTGATSAFSFGRGFGVVEGVLAALEKPTTFVRPQVWTKALGVGSDKGEHRRAAMRAWPRYASVFSRVKDDGRADAALLCHWWARHGIGTAVAHAVDGEVG